MKSVQRGVSTAQRTKHFSETLLQSHCSFLTQHSTAEKDVAMFPPLTALCVVPVIAGANKVKFGFWKKTKCQAALFLNLL